jgi:hypothetical protein
LLISSGASRAIRTVLGSGLAIRGCPELQNGGVVIGLVDIQEDYEAGYLDMRETLELFAELIRTGQAWNLPGHYIRTAHHLIDVEYITPRGQITYAGYKATNVEAVGKYHDEGREGSPCDVSVSNDPLGDGVVAVPNGNA